MSAITTYSDTDDVMNQQNGNLIDVDRPIRDTFLIFGSPHIEETDIEEVIATLRSGWIGTGPRVGRFEEAFRQYVGARHALAVNSCTAALHLSLLALGIGPGDEVITSPMTFAATANVVQHLGAKPVFVDSDRQTCKIDPARIEDAITSRTRAILPIHFAGRPCDMTPILDIARRHELYVIEDAAHAVGAQYEGRQIGTIGDLTAFSFYVTKNVVTGEGGMVTTDNEEWASTIKTMALHGLSKDAWKRYSDEGYQHYQVIQPGYKYNMMDIQAALGIHQLARLEDNLVRREEIWNRYDMAFQDLPVTLPAPAAPNTRHARHLYTLLIEIDSLNLTRDDVLQSLHAENIGTGVHYISLHLQPYYRESFGYQPSDYPNANYVSERTLSIPLSTKLTDDDVADVIASVQRVLRRARPRTGLATGR